MILKRKIFSTIEDEKLFFIDSYGNSYVPKKANINSLIKAHEGSEYLSREKSKEELKHLRDRRAHHNRQLSIARSDAKFLDKAVSNAHKGISDGAAEYGYDNLRRRQGNVLKTAEKAKNRLRKDDLTIKALEKSKRSRGISRILGDSSRGLRFAKGLR